MVDFPMPGVVDIRMPILGDSFTWAGVEPTAAKKSIVIHGTASEDPNEDGFTMADYHVNHNGWGGIGVHFVITKDSYPGRPGQTPAGAQIQYVGDLGTWRAGCLNQNPGRIHIEISGLFTGRTPSENQLRLVRELNDFMIAPNNILPSLNFHSQVTYHNAVPGQNTACPGWQYAHFQEWFDYVAGGAEPSWFSTQQPTPTPIPTPTPVPVPTPTPEPVTPEVTPSIPVTSTTPEYQITYVTESAALTTKLDCFAVDMTGAGAPIALQNNTSVNAVGHFTDAGTLYWRSDKSLAFDTVHGTWYGLKDEFVNPPTGQVPDAIIPVNVISKEADKVAIGFSKLIAAILSPIIRLISKFKGTK